MLEIVFESGINLLETFIIIDFVTRYLGCKYKDRRKYIGFISAWMVSFAELSLINYMYPFEGMGSLIPVVITFLYELIFLDGSASLKLWIAALIHIIVITIADSTNLIVCRIIDYDPNDMLTVFNSTRIISVIITKIIFFYASRVILRYKYKNSIDNQTLLMLILIPVISVISLTALMMAAMRCEEILGYIIGGMSGILLANIITYYFFLTMNKNYETRLKLKLLEQNNENAKKNIENADAFVRQMKSAEHDMRNQLLIIYSHIDNGKYTEAKDYIKSITDVYLPDIQNFINTNNDAFNAIINSKIAICNQKKIYIEIREMKNSLQELDAVDTCILFGNLLDNAIEAADKTKSRRISVDIQLKGCYLSVLVTNSIAASVLEHNYQLKTSKKNKLLHGIGIRTIKELVKKYDGMIQFFEENNEFCCHILLDMNINQDISKNHHFSQIQ